MKVYLTRCDNCEKTVELKEGGYPPEPWLKVMVSYDGRGLPRETSSTFDACSAECAQGLAGHALEAASVQAARETEAKLVLARKKQREAEMAARANG
jgi:hypothetical protein